MTRSYPTSPSAETVAIGFLVAVCLFVATGEDDVAAATPEAQPPAQTEQLEVRVACIEETQQVLVRRAERLEAWAETVERRLSSEDEGEPTPPAGDVDPDPVPPPPPVPAPDPEPEAGWSRLEPSPDSRVVHVCQACPTADDENPGSKDLPVRSLGAGYRLLRDGFPDHLLLRAGDLWREGLPNWQKSGRGPDEPMVVSRYGEGPLPSIRSNRALTMFVKQEEPRHDLVFAHLEIDGEGANGLDDWGVRIVEPVERLRLEGLRITGLLGGVSIDRGPHRDVTLFRCSIYETWNPREGSAAGHPLYIASTNGIELRECVFDQGGWREEPLRPPPAGMAIYRHNVYLQESNAGDVLVVDCLSSRSSSHGLQIRIGSTVRGNLLWRCSIPVMMRGLTTCTGNVVQRSKALPGGQGSRGWGLELSGVEGGLVQGNLVSLLEHGGRALGIRDSSVVTVSRNVFYRHGPLAVIGGGNSAIVLEANTFVSAGSPLPSIQHTLPRTLSRDVVTSRDNLFSSDPRIDVAGMDRPLSAWREATGDERSRVEASSLPAPDRDLEGYAHMLALEGADEWLEIARSQDVTSWRVQFTAAAARDWILAGASL